MDLALHPFGLWQRVHREEGAGPAAACRREDTRIERGSPWENGYNESFNGKLREELLNGEIFHNLTEAKVLIERWRNHINTIRPHSTLAARPPAPQTTLPNYANKPLANGGLRADRRWPKSDQTPT